MGVETSNNYQDGVNALRKESVDEWNAFLEATQLRLKLVQSNENHRIRLNEKEQTDWQLFKQSFNNDLDNLVEEIKALSTEIK